MSRVNCQVCMLDLAIFLRSWGSDLIRNTQQLRLHNFLRSEMALLRDDSSPRSYQIRPARFSGDVPWPLYSVKCLTVK